MSDRFARFLSIILHPILMPSYVLWFLLNHGSYYSAIISPFEKIGLYTVVVVFTLVFPAMVVNFLVVKGRITSAEMVTREERRIPFTSYLILLLTAYYLMSLLQLPVLPTLMVLGASIAVALSLLITYFWKISIHMVGIGGAMGVMFALNSLIIIDLSLPIVLTMLISGLLGTARLSLGAHDPMQVYAGFALGFLSEFLSIAW